VRTGARRGMRSDALGGKRLLAAIAAVPIVLITLTVVVTSLGWMHTTFPGFFVMANRVVPSIGLSHWSIGGRERALYQRQILTVDDVPMASAVELYAHVRAAPPGNVHRYGVRTDYGVETHALAAMPFTGGDWIAVFGALLLNGIIFTAVGLLVWILGPPVPATVGTVVVMLDLGLFCLTAMDLYGPARFFRVHVATEALFVPTLLHLALVFPVTRLGRLRRPVLWLTYGLGIVWAAAYEWWLFDPVVYSQIHNLCMVGTGIVGVGLILGGLQAYVTSPSLLVRKRLGVAALGMLTGFAVPAWLLTMSGLLGGEAPINLAAFTAFLFPLSLAYAVLKHDLFEIDALLRRATSYLVLTATVATLYAGMAFVVGAALQTVNAAQSALFPLLFGVVMVFGLIPMRDHIQRVVDRIYHRTNHDAQNTLQRASGALVATLDLDDISTLTIEIVCQSLIVRDASLWLHAADDTFVLAHVAGTGLTFRGPLGTTHPLVVHLRSGARAISIYDRDTEMTPTWDARRRERALRDLGADIVLPLGRGDPVGFLALGPKESGSMFTLDDVSFLATFANQVAVAVLNARSYRQVEELNVSLEQKVEQRTHELAVTNDQLETSLTERERAYRELQQSHETLVRTEKMATVGRLTAGIAHEVNTPLGATLNSLKTLEELIEEYTASIGDPGVTEDDHRALAQDLATTARNISTWTNKAAGYIRSVKAHTRNLDRTEECAFDLTQLIADTRLLLEHQFRHASCTLTVDCPPAVMLFGDAGKLGQVLTNLLTNAIDAYEGSSKETGDIRLRVRSSVDEVVIAVEDDGAGIAAEHRDRIFEELFTTKPSGRGTGLGLPISRAIVAKCFGGRLDVTSELGRGSCFTIAMPQRLAASAPLRAQA
jgi:signal transduction histidine kinase